jgi:hypothetical protein
MTAVFTYSWIPAMWERADSRARPEFFFGVYLASCQRFRSEPTAARGRKIEGQYFGAQRRNFGGGGFFGAKRRDFSHVLCFFV